MFRSAPGNLTFPFRCVISLWLLLLARELCPAQTPELFIQSGHANAVYALTYSSDGRMMASGGYDSTVKLWDVATGTELRTFRGHSDVVRSVAFGAKDKVIASGADDETVKLWDVATGVEIRTLHHPYLVTEVAFSPDGKTLAAASGDGSITLWNPATGARLREIRAHSDYAQTIAFSPDGKVLASGGWDRLIKLWDASTGKELRTLSGHSDSVLSIAFSPDNRTLASGGDDKSVRLWDTVTGEEIRTLGRHSKAVYSVAFSPDGKTLAAGSIDGSVRLWETRAGKELYSISSHNYVQTVAFSPDGKVLASGGGGADQEIKLWHAATGERLGTLKGLADDVYSVAFSRDGRTMATGSSAGLIRLWDVRTGMELRTLAGHSTQTVHVLFSPDGKILASGCYDNTAKLWNPATGRELRTFNHSKPILSMSFSPDGRTFVTGDEETVKFWDVATGREVRPLAAAGLTDPVAFSRDGTLATGARDGGVRLWDVAAGKELRAFNQPDILTATFSPDGRTLAIQSYPGLVTLWDVKSGVALRTLEGSRDLRSVAFSPDGKLFAGGSWNNSIRLWDVATGEELPAAGRPDVFNAVTFSPDGRTLASGNGNGVRLWELSTRRELAALIALGKKDWAVVTPDGLFDGSPAAWNQVLWRFGQDTFNYSPAEAFFYEYFYPGLLTDIFAGERPHASQSIVRKDRRQPRVKILTPELLTESVGRGPDGRVESRPFMRVSVEVAEAPADASYRHGSGARDVRLFRDGTLVKLWRGDVLGGKEKVTLETEIPVAPGAVTLSSYAFNGDNVKSLDASLTTEVGRPATGPPPRTAYVLAVGINQYANPRYNLRYAVADARDFGREWSQQQEGVKQFDRVVVVPLYNREATKANILLAFSRLVEPKTAPLPPGAPAQLEQLGYAEPQDAVVVFFAGHGVAEGRRFYLIPHDLGYAGGRGALTAEGLRRMLEHGVNDEEIERALEGLQSSQTVLIIDACNSGQVLEAEEKRRGPMNAKGLAQLAYEKGISVLTAAQSFQQARAPMRLGHGYLTYALVEEGMRRAAADADGDGQVVLREWLDYATLRVPQMQEARGERRVLVHGSAGGSSRAPALKAGVQHPRLFYRREAEATPLVVAIPAPARPD